MKKMKICTLTIEKIWTDNNVASFHLIYIFSNLKKLEGGCSFFWRKYFWFCKRGESKSRVWEDSAYTRSPLRWKNGKAFTRWCIPRFLGDTATLLRQGREGKMDTENVTFFQNPAYMITCIYMYIVYAICFFVLSCRFHFIWIERASLSPTLFLQHEHGTKSYLPLLKFPAF